MTRGRIEWVDTAKAIAITLVVLVHATTWLRFAGLDSPELRAFNAAFNSLRMPLFFFASGLFAAKWVATPWRHLFRGKVAGLLWVFLLWQPVVFAYKMLAALTLPDQQDSTVAAHLFRVVISPLRPNGELWFLWALALAFILAKLGSRLRPSIHISIAVLLALSWSAVIEPMLGVGLARVVGDGWAGLASYYVFFVVALYCRDVVFAVVNRAPSALAPIAFILWGVVTVIVVASRIVNDIPALTLPFQFLGLLGGIGLAVSLERVRQIAWLGSRTLEVYVAHTFFIVVAASLLHLLPLGDVGPVVTTLTIVAVAAGAIAASLALKRVLSRTPARIMYALPDAIAARLSR